jgi:hypothetical protein
MAIIVPNSASTYSAAACVPSSKNRWAWLGFVPNLGASGGSMVWYTGTAASNGSPLLPIIVASGPAPVMQGPFMSPCGFFAASVTTGCAVIWLKNAS